MKQKLWKLVLEIAREKIGVDGREFTTAEMWEELKKRWAFKLSKQKTVVVLKGLVKDGHLSGRREDLEEWAWSSTAYRWMWRLV